MNSDVTIFENTMQAEGYQVLSFSQRKLLDIFRSQKTGKSCEARCDLRLGEMSAWWNEFYFGSTSVLSVQHVVVKGMNLLKS